MDQSRREFLLKLAAGSAYAAPLLWSVAAPESLSAQNAATAKGGGGGSGPGGGMGGMTSTTEFQFGPSAPWTTNP